MQHLFSLRGVFVACLNRRAGRCNQRYCTLSTIGRENISAAGPQGIMKYIKAFILCTHNEAKVKVQTYWCSEAACFSV